MLVLRGSLKQYLESQRAQRREEKVSWGYPRRARRQMRQLNRYIGKANAYADKLRTRMRTDREMGDRQKKEVDRVLRAVMADTSDAWTKVSFWIRLHP